MKRDLAVEKRSILVLMGSWLGERKESPQLLSANSNSSWSGDVKAWGRNVSTEEPQV
jgi:hypothetical protein